MGVVNTNVPALNAQRHLGITAFHLAKSVERLSSGLRINRAADDAAGLSISEKLRAQVRGLNQAVRNAQDGISMIQTGEGALNEVHAILQRMRELAVQASNGTLTMNDRNAIQSELNQLQEAIDKIGDSTQFNTLRLLTGDLAVTLDTLSIMTFGLGEGTVEILSSTGVRTGHDYTLVDDGVADTIVLEETNAGGDVTRSQRVSLRGMVASDVQTLNFDAIGVVLRLSTSAAYVAQTSAAIIAELDTSTAGTTGTGANVVFQTGANNVTADTITVAFTNMKTGAGGIGLASVDVSTVANANTLITNVDAAITIVSTQRARLGAKQNQLERTIANLNVASENLTASESRIRDLDVAAETVNFTKLQILQQAGTAILAQANVSPQNVLALLR